MPGNHVRRWNGDILLFFCRFLPLPSTSIESDSGPKSDLTNKKGAAEKGRYLIAAGRALPSAARRYVIDLPRRRRLAAELAHEEIAEAGKPKS